jgi:hypothetical protein
VRRCTVDIVTIHMSAREVERTPGFPAGKSAIDQLGHEGPLLLRCTALTCYT